MYKKNEIQKEKKRLMASWTPNPPLSLVFLKAATVESEGVKFLSPDDFRLLVLKNVSQVDLDKPTLDQGVSLVRPPLLL